MSKRKATLFIGIIILFVGYFVFSSEKDGSIFLSGLGAILFGINSFSSGSTLAGVLYTVIPILAFILLLIGLKVKFMGVIGSLYFLTAGISLVLTQFGIDIPVVLLDYVVPGIIGPTTELIFGYFPLHFAYSGIYGLGGLLISFGSFLSFIGVLIYKKVDW